MSKVTVTMEEINRLFWIHTIRGCFAEFLAVAIFVFIGMHTGISEYHCDSDCNPDKF